MRRRNLYLLAGLLCLALVAAGVLTTAMAQPNYAKVKEYRIERSVPPEAQACIECHRVTTPGVFADWAKSRHANANITCLDCHLVQPGDQDIAQDHAKYYGRSDMPWGEAKYKMDIASIVTPKDCSRCHPDEATQYSKSKHANTIEIMWKIDPWLNKGMNSDNERKTGCFNCHGTVIAIDANGKIDPATWPNAGVGPAEPGRQQGVVHLLPHPPPLFRGRSRRLKPATSATWARTIPRSRSTRSPSTARSTTPIRTSTISTPPAAHGRRAWTTARPPARPAT
jgi:hypothetical protein